MQLPHSEDGALVSVHPAVPLVMGLVQGSEHQISCWMFEPIAPGSTEP